MKIMQVYFTMPILLQMVLRLMIHFLTMFKYNKNGGYNIHFN